jgi:diguanylate cyclase (GGDEF)-like protein/PAS domain S-box-containing protein
MSQQGTALKRGERRTEIERLQRALDEQVHFLQEVVDVVPVPVFFEDPSGHLRGCNKAFLELFAASREEIAGKALSDLARERGDAAAQARDADVVRRLGARAGEMTFKGGDGRRHVVTVDRTTHLDAGGSTDGFIGVISDVTAVRRSAAQTERLRSELGDAREQLAAVSTSDTLTGLGNHRGLDETLDHEWRRAGRSGAPIAFLMVDIDEFSVFNDTYGHIAGDECLVAIADALRGCMRRPGDSLGRYSGEQFLAVLPGTGEEGAQAVAESMREAVTGLDIPDRESPRRMVTISVGVAVAERGRYSDPWSAVAAADAAVCRAKRLGCDRVVVSGD